ncbi:uncharacterized protein LOC113207564 [Frankliniella occidentalis]|uniref:Uncharacterized protein LOC113207564 n=1 Tax=Frankliniella occidentalis TaxID=133901 RepID=A0A6J1SN57_FRAOC|nr:uncharacterized protein LOC113207564 [Frankliniella occidentalis]
MPGPAASLSAWLVSGAAFGLVLVLATPPPAGVSRRAGVTSDLPRADNATPGSTYLAQMDMDRGWMCSSVCSKAVDKQVAYCMCVGCDEQGQCVYNEPDCALRCRCNCNGRLGDVDAAAAALTMPGWAPTPRMPTPSAPSSSARP